MIPLIVNYQIDVQTSSQSASLNSIDSVWALHVYCFLIIISKFYLHILEMG